MNDVTMRATLIAQSYLIEFLLMNLLHQQDDPRKVIQAIRLFAEAQLREDLTNGVPLPQSASADAELVSASTHQLTAMLDRVETQFANPAPAWGKN